MILPITATCYLLSAALMSDFIEQDQYAGAIQVFHYSFENDQDRDFDRQPDDWTRRKGSGFPFYVKAEIDPQRGQGESSQSLRFFVNGGPVVFYSPPVKIDGLHSYVFEGYVRTQLLRNDAVLISLSFLNEKRERILRVLSRPVTGTHSGWVKVRIGPVVPMKDIRSVVVGCHLVNGKKMDLRGSVWFDNLWLGKLPQMTLVSNFQSHFKKRSASIEVMSNISGLDQVLQFSTKIGAEKDWDLFKELDKGQLPAQLKNLLIENNIQLSGSTRIKRDEQGGWIISDGEREYLILFDQSLLEVYDANSSYQLDLQISDISGRITGTKVFHLKAGHPRKRSSNDEASTIGVQQIWNLDPLEYGYYTVDSVLQRNGEPILKKKTSFAVMDVAPVRGRSEFGWSVSRGAKDMPLTELADVAAQADTHWLKFPVWRSMYSDEPASSFEIDELFGLLAQHGITPVGILSNPPADLRNQFARKWSGVSEIFTMPTDFWSSSLDPVLARYSSHIQHWQLGDDFDTSFIGLNSLSETLSSIKHQFDQIGRNAQIGLTWDWEKPVPPGVRFADSFLFFTSEEPLTGPELIQKLSETSGTPAPRWILLQPLPRSKHNAEERGADLAKKMVAAKIGGADGIFAYDVFDEEFGLLERSGAPSQLFLPWRTIAMALHSAEYLGSFNLPGGSNNFAFAHENEVIVIVWNNKPQTERVFLGEDIIVMDIWGRQFSTDIDSKTRQQILKVGPTPLVIRRCSEPIARWRLATRFNTQRLESKHGSQPITITTRNTFPAGISGIATLNVPSEWQIDSGRWTFQSAQGEKLAIPLNITLPPNASLGDVKVSIDFEISAERRYKFRVYRSFDVGLGDVQLVVTDRKRKDGILEIEQIIFNNTNAPTQVLNFKCRLSIPGRRRRIRYVTKLGQGKDRKIYVIPNAEALRGKPLRLQAEEIDGDRLLNYEWKVGLQWGDQ
jgi:hypothetical protein